MTPIFVVGHSHINALTGAIRERPLDAEYKAVIINMVRFGKEIGTTNFIEEGPHGGISLHVGLRQLLNPIEFEDHSERLTVSMIGGNSHNMLGLTQHPMPFDFVLPTQPELRLDREAQIIPYSVMEDVIIRLAQLHLDEISALRSAVAGPVVHLESPPPIGDDSHVSLYLDQYFDKKQSKLVAPRHLRYKLWRLHSNIVRRHCGRIDVSFIDVPEETLDTDGFLRREGYPKNATHGNFWYGQMVLKQVERIADRIALNKGKAYASI